MYGGNERCRIGRFDTLGQAGRYWCFLGIVARVGRRGVLFPVFARQENVLDYNAWAEGTLKGIKQEKGL